MPDPFDLDAAADLFAALRHSAAGELRELARILDPADDSAAPAPDLLRALAPQVAYQMVAMEAAQRQWQREHSWLALENVLLQTRMLQHFFWSDRGMHHGDIVTAEHFCPEWRTANANAPAMFERSRGTVDRLLAYLTRDRAIDPQALDIDVDAMTGTIWQAWHRLLASPGIDEYAGLLRWYLAERAAEWQVDIPPG